MKKLISLLMVLTLVLSLVGGIGTSALASEEPEVTAAEEALVPETEEVAEDSTAEPAEEPVEEPAEEPAEESSEEPAEEPAEEPTEEPAEDGATLYFTVGKSYVLGVDNGNGTMTVLTCPAAAGNVTGKTINKADAGKDATTVWTAAASSSKGVQLTNGSLTLYYSGSVVTAAEVEKKNWNMDSDGNLYYDGQGKKYAGTPTATGVPYGDTKVVYTAIEVVEKPQWTKVSSAADGKKYVVAIAAGESFKVLKNNSGTIGYATISDIADADESEQWVCEVSGSRFTLKNNGTYLYYDKTNLVVTSRTSNDKINWSYDGTTLKYIAGGDSYSVNGTNTAAFTIVKASTGTAVDLYEEGDGSGSGGQQEESKEEEKKEESGTSGYVQVTAFDAAEATGSGFVVGTVSDMSIVTLLNNDGNAEADAGKTVTGTEGSYALSSINPRTVITATKSEKGGGKVRFALEVNSQYIYVEDGAIKFASAADGLDNWGFKNGHLFYDIDGTKYYAASPWPTSFVADESSAVDLVLLNGSGSDNTGGGGGGNKETDTTDADAPQIVAQPEAVTYVVAGTNYAAPKFSVTVTVPETTYAGIDKVYFQWYIDGEKVAVVDEFAKSTEAITDYLYANCLGGLTEPGIHPIYCECYCILDGVTKTNTTNTVNFIVCKGVEANSFITFSDMHSSFSNVTAAINDTMKLNGGLVPALILATGDWTSSHYSGGDETSEDFSKTMNNYIKRIAALVGGIDIVYVSGNHDNGTAAAAATVEANLGADKDYDGTGVVYSSHADTDSVGSSAANEGLQIYGINYEEIGSDYSGILAELEAFLQDVKANHPADVVVISAHAGLHAMGVQPESKGDSWGGGGSYNIDGANEVVKLLNKYGDDLDIMYFFGHNHSKGDDEFILKRGDTIKAVVSYSNKTTEDIVLKFTYGQAGYVANNTGASSRYSYVTWDDETISRDMSVAGGDGVAALSVDISRIAEIIRKTVKFDTGDAKTTETDNFIVGETVAKPADPVRKGYTFGGWFKDADCTLAWNFDTDVVTADTVLFAKWTQNAPDAPAADKNPSKKAPKTGDDSNIVLWTVVLAASAAAVVVLPKKKFN